MIKCERVNRMIAIPHCIWCNFTYAKDFCRWIVYDTDQSVEEPEYRRKIYADAFGFKKIAYFNYHRDESLDNIEYIEDKLECIEEVNMLFKQQQFEDHSDHEKNWIRNKYANHLPKHSLMMYEECSEEEKQAILSRLVFLTPHPQDEKGHPIPMFKDYNGNIKSWPINEKGYPVSVYELDKHRNESENNE